MKKTKEKTLFNLTFQKICKIFKINRVEWECIGKGYDYSHMAQHYVPADLSDIMVDFISLFKEKIPQERIIEKAEDLREIVKDIQAEIKGSKHSQTSIKLDGTYKDIENILTVAYDITTSVKGPDKFPNVNFDDTLLIPTGSFIGRTNIIQESLEELMQKSVCLYGVGGNGKTEIVKAIINKIIKAPIDKDGLYIENIYWINFQNETDINGEQSFKETVIRATDPKACVDNENRDLLYNKSIHEILKKAGRTLVVVDNVEVFTDTLLGFLNRINKSRVVLATRCDPCDKLATKKYADSNEYNFHLVKVGELSLEECRDLFGTYCPFLEREVEQVDKIIKLLSRHTVSVELVSKLIRKQEKTIDEFLKVLIENGFKLDFDDEREELVSSKHYLMNKERRIIDQLTRLFNTVSLSEDERSLLIKFSTVPNIECYTKEAEKWFSLSKRDELLSLASLGWIKKRELKGNKNKWVIHPIIASAVRARHSECLYEECQSFIKNLTENMKKYYEDGLKTPEMLIQFSWSLTDIFKDRLESLDDVAFLYTLGEIYQEIGFIKRASYIFEKAISVTEKVMLQNSETSARKKGVVE